jgi:hypothetical protein
MLVVVPVLLAFLKNSRIFLEKVRNLQKLTLFRLGTSYRAGILIENALLAILRNCTPKLLKSN